MSVRTYFRRDKPIQIEQLDGVVAVRGSQGMGPTNPASEIGISSVSLRALERAGWLLMEDARADRASNDLSAPVFRKGNSVLLGAPTINVQFTDDLDRASAEQILIPNGFRILKELPFAPGLFQVSLAESIKFDALDAANMLRQVPGVRWAEPEFLEVISGRV